MNIKESFEKIIAQDKNFLKFYNIKKRIFPIYDLLEYFPTEGKLIDLGCGNGLFEGLLALRNKQLEIFGVDDDTRKIETAKRLFNYENLHFIKENIIDYKFQKANHFSLIDVLYLIPFELQEKIIKDISENIENGVLLIKEMNKIPLYKFLFNYLQETVSVKIIKRTLGGKFYFRNEQNMINLLSKYNFKVKVIKMDKGYLYPHILYIGSKG